VPDSVAYNVYPGTKYDRHASRKCELAAVVVHGTPLLSLDLFTAVSYNKRGQTRSSGANRAMNRIKGSRKEQFLDSVLCAKRDASVT
jgi:hypothetical protein